MSEPALQGIKVAVFEARMADELGQLVRRHGGEAISAPAVKEVPLSETPEIVDFATRLRSGSFDYVVFETGVGLKYLDEILSNSTDKSLKDWRFNLLKTKVIARGPKPGSVLREWKIPIYRQVQEPNTWVETLALFDAELDVRDRQVAVQEYGKPIPELTEGLVTRGANVTRVAVYRWSLPDDLNPLKQAIHGLINGEIPASLFTAGVQVDHLFQIAGALKLEDALKNALQHHVVVGSIGPTTSNVLRSHDIAPDLEPNHPKLGHLVAEFAACYRRLAREKSGG